MAAYSTAKLRMKNITFKIIGTIALTLGVYFLHHTASYIFYSSVSMNLLTQISKLTLAWIAIYGGYQTIRLNDSGKRLLIIYFVLNFFGLVVSFMSLGFAVKNAGGDLLELYQPKFILYYVGYFSFLVVAMVLLWRNNTDVFKVDTNTRQKEIVGKLLSQLMPGLGRAFLGNIWSGFALFVVYLILVSGHFYFSVSSVESYPIGLLIFEIVYDLVVWKIFAGIDWEFVKNTEHPPKASPPSLPMLYSEQNGG